MHKIAVKNRGKDDVNNLIHLHKTCHKTVHTRKSLRLEPDDA
ncbi:hypothetical protein F7734_54015 [Scytonema sp. UIC 10036]|nr:hypothetical protein [Scytonema sp. UIC 10036]